MNSGKVDPAYIFPSLEKTVAWICGQRSMIINYSLTIPTELSSQHNSRVISYDLKNIMRLSTRYTT